MHALRSLGGTPLLSSTSVSGALVAVVAVSALLGLLLRRAGDRTKR